MVLKILLAVLMAFTIVRTICDIRYYSNREWYRSKKKIEKLYVVVDFEKWNMLSVMCIIVIGYNIL